MHNIDKHALVLVNNSIIHDNRVLKYADTLATMVRHVSVVGKEEAGTDVSNAQQNITFYRLPHLALGTLCKKIIRAPFVVFQLPWQGIILSFFLACTLLGFIFPLKFLSRFRSTAGMSRAYNTALRPFLNLYLTLDCYFAFYHQILALKPDIIHCHDLETLFVSIKAAKKLKIPVIYDVHELETHRNDRQEFCNRWFAHAMEKRFAPKAKAVITVSDGIADLIKETYRLNDVSVIFNSPRTEIAPSTSPTIRQTLGIKEEDFLVVYVGLVTIDRGLFELTHALSHSQRFKLAMVGPQNQEVKQQILELAEKLGVKDRLYMLPPVKPNDVTHFVSSADLGVITVHNLCKSYDFSMPNKLFEMSLAGLPILATNLGSIVRYVKENNIGTIIDSMDPKNIARAIENHIESNIPVTQETIDSLKNKYSWESQERKIGAIYRKIFSLS